MSKTIEGSQLGPENAGFDNSESQAKKTAEFDWISPNYKEIMQNDIYKGLYEREQKRMRVIFDTNNEGEELTSEDMLALRDEVVAADEKDSSENLQTDLERREYEVFSKYETLNRLEKEGSLDAGMYTVCSELQRLPFRTHQTCSGHPEKDGVVVEINDGHVLAIMPSWNVSEEEAEVQRSFVHNIADLNSAICFELSIEPIEILSLIGEFDYDDEGVLHSLTVDEALDMGADMHFYFNGQLFGTHMKRDEYKRVLNTMWQEFTKYSHRFIPEREFEVPDFDGGEVFFENAN